MSIVRNVHAPANALIVTFKSIFQRLLETSARAHKVVTSV